MAHIWACPPSEGDDYIFHCHPIEQKIPKPKRLQEWYKKMLDKGIVERIVLDYKVSTKKSLFSNITVLMQAIPYQTKMFYTRFRNDFSNTFVKRFFCLNIYEKVSKTFW